MDSTITWLFAFVGLYWAYCLFWGIKGFFGAKSSSDYFIAGRQISVWVFILAATATSFSGWTFVGHPGKIFTDGLPYAFASFYALTIPLTGVLFLRRQWVLGQAFRYVTPGEMYSDIFGGNAIRILTVIVAFLFSVPYLGVQLKASGSLFNILTDDWVSVNLGMYALTAVVVVYVASGGLRSVAYVDCAQCVLLAVGIVAIGIVAVVKIGGWGEFVEGMQSFVSADLAKGENLTPAGHSHYVALPGSIQMVSEGGKSQGGPWTGIMCMTYMFALMGIQASPAFSMWAFANKTSRAFRWQQVVASSLVIGLILFTFTIFQGVAGWILSSNGTFTGVNDKTLVPELINLLSGSTPWLVALLAVCALAAMQSTGAAYMSTFSGMITRDVYKRYIKPDASESAQKLCGRIFVVIVALAALVVASFAKDALVMLGGLAVAYGFQMFPALMGACYFPWLSRRGIAIGLVAGLLGVTLTDNTVTWFAWLGVPWGKYPLTIHSAGWGILFNLLFAIGGSFLLPDSAAQRESRAKRSRFLGELTAVEPEKQKFKWLGLGLILVWFLVGFGPFATIGNTLFSDPNSPETWGPFGLPSLWVWQFLMLAFGVFVMWFLAFFLGFSKPISTESIEVAKRKHYPESE